MTVDRLVVRRAGGAVQRPEDPSALVAVLETGCVVPRVQVRVGDRLVVLVTGDVQCRVGFAAVRVLTLVAAERPVRPRLIRVGDLAASGTEVTVVRAVVLVCAAGDGVAEAAPDIGWGKEEVERVVVLGPSVRLDDTLDLRLELAIRQADARLELGAVPDGKVRRVDDRARERRGVGNVPGTVGVLRVGRVDVALLPVVGRDVAEVLVDDRAVRAADRVAGRNPVDRVRRVRVHYGSAVVGQVAGAERTDRRQAGRRLRRDDAPDPVQPWGARLQGSGESRSACPAPVQDEQEPHDNHESRCP